MSSPFNLACAHWASGNHCGLISRIHLVGIGHGWFGREKVEHSITLLSLTSSNIDHQWGSQEAMQACSLWRSTCTENIEETSFHIQRWPESPATFMFVMLSNTALHKVTIQTPPFLKNYSKGLFLWQPLLHKQWLRSQANVTHMFSLCSALRSELFLRTCSSQSSAFCHHPMILANEALWGCQCSRLQ